jgi:hypothetical protein
MVQVRGCSFSKINLPNFVQLFLLLLQMIFNLLLHSI